MLSGGDAHFLIRADSGNLQARELMGSSLLTV
jgi:hypothetical protein